MVGDFDSNILPLFRHYATKIRVHILLSDKRYLDSQQAKTMTKGIKKYCKKKSHNIERLNYSFDEDSIESIQNVYKKICKHLLKKEELYFNASDGLASTLAILLPLITKDKASILAYDRFENTCNIVKGETMTQITVSPMSISEHFTLKNIGYELIEEDKAMRKRKDSLFKLLQNSDDYMQFKKEINTIDANHKLYWMKQELEKIQKSALKNYAQGTIFEEYCYWLVKDLGFDDVRLGVKIVHNPGTDKDFENELDILLIKDNHLHTIECKLRTHIDGEHFIYKYDSVGKLLDADGRRMIVAIGGDNLKVSPSGKRKYQFNRSQLKRARQADIYVYQKRKMNAKEFQEKVKSFLLRED